MSEFIDQFILESREYVEQASAGLIDLERSPENPELLDSVFRAFHTLKGGASIVDFSAMERAMHAAEEVLTRARSGEHALNPALIEACLQCLDQVSRWLDAMSTTNEVPSGADADANRMADRIARAGGGQALEVRTGAKADWVDVLMRSHPELRHSAKTALRFTPLSSSFFQGEDPLALLESLDGLLWLDLEPIDAWPTLEQFDPFECMLTFTALVSTPAPLVKAHLQQYARACEIIELATAVRAARSPLPATARELLSAQIELLSAEPAAESFEGHVRSAAAVVTNVLTHAKQQAGAAALKASLDESLRIRSAQPLRNAIADRLNPESEADASASVDAISEVASSDLTLSRTLRVDAERVDALVRLTGELTVVKNAIGHAIKLQHADSSSAHGTLKEHHAALDHLVGELQRAVLAIRVLPLRAVLQRFPRVVREMSAQLGKSVKLVIAGKETEADKTIVEMLFEPLLHIVRNAMDHGIEPPEVRTRTGKEAGGTLRIHASRQGANVLIEVQDDGRGVDVERVRQVALDRGIASADDLRAMSDADIVDLIFAPGFSTSTSVTEVSGRGVGMDAVRSAVERVGGRAAIESTPGEGTTVRLTLPFSVMMTHVMTVEAGGQMFGIPLDAVIETLSVPAQQIQGVGAAKAFVHRDRTIPVIELSKVLSVHQNDRFTNEVIIVVASVAGGLGGIQVDRLGERMEVMLKPLDGLLAEVPGLTGTTILGDGRVLLVLDLGGVLQ